MWAAHPERCASAGDAYLRRGGAPLFDKFRALFRLKIRQQRFIDREWGFQRAAEHFGHTVDIILPSISLRRREYRHLVRQDALPFPRST